MKTINQQKGDNMKKWIDLSVNEICYLENQDNYVSISESINETALRLKLGLGYETFIVMGNHKNTINDLKDDLEVMQWFLKNTNGLWSNDIETLKDYINGLTNENN